MDVKVQGMMCEGCASTVTAALKGAKGVSSVNVDLPQGIATVGFQVRLLGACPHGLLLFSGSAEQMWRVLQNAPRLSQQADSMMEVLSLLPACVDAVKVSRARQSPCPLLTRKVAQLVTPPS